MAGRHPTVDRRSAQPRSASALRTPLVPGIAHRRWLLAREPSPPLDEQASISLLRATLRCIGEESAWRHALISFRWNISVPRRRTPSCGHSCARWPSWQAAAVAVTIRWPPRQHLPHRPLPHLLRCPRLRLRPRTHRRRSQRPGLPPSLHRNLLPSLRRNLLPGLRRNLLPSLHRNLLPSRHPSRHPSQRPDLRPSQSLHPRRSQRPDPLRSLPRLRRPNLLPRQRHRHRLRLRLRLRLRTACRRCPPPDRSPARGRPTGRTGRGQRPPRSTAGRACRLSPRSRTTTRTSASS
jgi:hypothetical protein